MTKLENLVIEWRDARVSFLSKQKVEIKDLESLAKAEDNLCRYVGKNLNPNNTWVLI